MSYTIPKPQSASELTTDCTYCGAKAGTWCTTRKGKPSPITHAHRYQAWYSEYVLRPKLEAIKAKRDNNPIKRVPSTHPIGDILPVDTAEVIVDNLRHKAYIYMYDHVVYETDKAYLLAIDGLKFWVPKSLIIKTDVENSAIYVIYRSSFNSVS